MNNESEAFLFAASIPKENAGDGLTRQVLGFDASIMMARVSFDQGAIGEIHSHPHAQTTYVESGVFDVTIDGVVKRLGAGDGFYVRPHLDHGAVCREPGVLIDVFSPIREDFLKESP